LFLEKFYWAFFPDVAQFWRAPKRHAITGKEILRNGLKFTGVASYAQAFSSIRREGGDARVGLPLRWARSAKRATWRSSPALKDWKHTSKTTDVTADSAS
jgi:hypothetical protein